jgi:hypothetical protein
MLHFGPNEDIATIDKWLRQCTKRTLCSMQVCGASFRSVLIAYQLLQGEFPVPNLASGILRCGVVPPPLAEEPNSEALERAVTAFLEKIRLYASFPDE